MASFCILRSKANINYVKGTKEDKKKFLICADFKRGNLSPRKAVKIFSSSVCVCVCARKEEKPLNSRWSDFLLKRCQNVTESEVFFFFFSLIDISQIPNAFLLSNYSCNSNHVSTPSCNVALKQSISSLYLVETLMIFLSQRSLVNCRRSAHPERSVQVP